MARWEFKLPDIGEGVGEGEIVAWLVRPGGFIVEWEMTMGLVRDTALTADGSCQAPLAVEDRSEAWHPTCSP